MKALLGLTKTLKSNHKIIERYPLLQLTTTTTKSMYFQNNFKEKSFIIQRPDAAAGKSLQL